MCWAIVIMNSYANYNPVLLEIFFINIKKIDPTNQYSSQKLNIREFELEHVWN